MSNVKFQENKLNLITSTTGNGKTSTLCKLAVENPTTSLFISCELTRKLIHKRLDAYGCTQNFATFSLKPNGDIADLLEVVIDNSVSGDTIFIDCVELMKSSDLVSLFSLLNTLAKENEITIVATSTLKLDGSLVSNTESLRSSLPDFGNFYQVKINDNRKQIDIFNFWDGESEYIENISESFEMKF